VSLALRWTLYEPVGKRYRVSLRLSEPDGWLWSVADDWLLDAEGNPTDDWRPGAASVTYHLLPLPPGLPPLVYTVSTGVYSMDDDGIVAQLDLIDAEGNPSGHFHAIGSVPLRQAAGVRGDPYGAAPELTTIGEPGVLDAGVALEAAWLDRRALAPGESVYVTLRWRATDAPLPRLRPVLILEQAGSNLAESGGEPANGRYPTTLWQQGERVLERRRLTAPPGAGPGPANVAVELAGQRILLGEVVLEAQTAVFEPPAMGSEVSVRFGEVAELLGYNLAPEPYISSQPVTITLYWRALPGATDADYTVFAHLLAADGHLVAQHDGPPAGGARPTRGWLQGEVIADTHAMVFRESYSGPATIAVGLYEAAAVDRVLTSQGETAALLPTAVSISRRGPQEEKRE
jgi:hypothetical protein